MAPWRRKGSRCWWVTFTRRGTGKRATSVYHRMSTGTHHHATALEMETCLRALTRRGSREWDLVEALIARRVDLPSLYDHWTTGTLETLRAQLADRDLASLVDQWEKAAARELAAETFRKYKAQVAWLFPRDVAGKRLPVLRSTLTRAWLAGKLSSVPGSNTNRRRHGAAWVSVMAYLTERGGLEVNPMRDVTLPASNKAERPRIDRFRDVLRYLEAMPDGPHRALAALREGAGLEISAALAMRKSDIVDAEHRIVWAHGDKNEYRDRQAIVEPWAWKRVDAYVRAGAFLPDAKLFPVTEKAHRTVHNAVCAQLRAEGVDIPDGYTLHCCRNTYAVRNVKRGADLWLVANNLGHSDTTTVQRLYGKFRPKVTDLVRASKQASGGRL